MSRKNIWNLDQNNLYAFVRRWAPPSDFFYCLLQNLEFECVHLSPTAGFLVNDERM